MALTDENGSSLVMPVAPMYGGGQGGFGFGGDFAWILLLILLGGWGGFGGFGGGMGAMMGAGMMGMDFLYPWLNNSQNINDGFRAQQIGTDIGSIRDGVQGIAQQMCECCGNMRYDMATGFNGVERSVTGAQNALAQQMYANQIAELERSYAAQTATAQGFNGTQAGLADLKFTIAQEECATRNASAMNARDIIDATTRGNQAILDKLCQLELDGYKRDNDNLRSQLQFANMQASQTAQTADLRASQLAATSALVQELRQCPIPSQPVYGNQPIFTCAQNVAASNYGCGCNGYVA